MAFARGACVAPIFVGLFHSRRKGVAHVSFFITGACLPPPWLIETFGLALNTQRGAMDGVRYKGCFKPAM